MTASTTQRLVNRLQAVGRCNPTQLGYLCVCPRHRYTLGLSITVEAGVTSYVCWDGCSTDEIAEALNATQTAP